jgi:LytS/YehU family sensor histidine kinase
VHLLDGSLRIAVKDTGRGFSAQSQPGVGLENVRKRLELSYGGSAKLEIAGGSQIVIEIPVPVEVAG